MDMVYYLGWFAPVAACYFAWPLLRRRRAYVVAAGVLCLTPLLGYPLVFWPLVIVLVQATVFWFSPKVIFVVCLPAAACATPIVWLAIRNFVPARQPAAPGAGHSGSDSRPDRRRKPLRMLRHLLLLLIATMAYARIADTVWRVV